jgi:hypothetical protein
VCEPYRRREFAPIFNDFSLKLCSKAAPLPALDRPQRTRPAQWLWERVMRQNLSETLRELMRTFAQPFDPYRPELHYMRGPGPKCRSKRAGRAESAAPAAATNTPGLREIAQAHA